MRGHLYANTSNTKEEHRASFQLDIPRRPGDLWSHHGPSPLAGQPDYIDPCSYSEPADYGTSD